MQLTRQGDSLESTVWNGMMMPKGTPDVVVNKLNAARGKVLDDAKMRRQP